MARHLVKSGSVTLEVLPWIHPVGREYWRASYYEPSGKRRHITRATLADAKEAAFLKAQELAKGTIDFANLTPAQIRGIKRMLDADPQLSHVDEFLAWRAATKVTKAVAEAVDSFLDQKQANRGNSKQNYNTLAKILGGFRREFASRNLRDITAAEIQSFIQAPRRDGAPSSPRTRHNTRRGLITFFRWCRAHKWLPSEPTAAEATERPVITRKIPETYTPEELATMLAAVRPEYLPWLATAAFAGVRTEEIAPDDGGEKSPLDWSDFHWDRDIIIVRPETAKTKHRRIVPILPPLRAWLKTVRQTSGPICAVAPPARKVAGRGEETETKRLGALIGGWRKNALRHSFISYRAALVGLGQTAMEAGNSESEAKRSYNDAKGKDEAKRWFALKPGTPENTKRKSLKIKA